MLDSAASAILAHTGTNSEGLVERPNQTSRAESVTMRHYNRSQRIPLKTLGMKAWNKELSEARVRQSVG